jgi:hypothetical protein
MSLDWKPKKVEASGNMQFEATDASGERIRAVWCMYFDGDVGGAW